MWLSLHSFRVWKGRQPHAFFMSVTSKGVRTAIQGAFPVEFGTVFPHGAFALGVEAVANFETKRPEGDRETGLPFRPVEFEGMTVMPYVDDSGRRPRVAYSLRARGIKAPGAGGRRAAKDAA